MVLRFTALALASLSLAATPAMAQSAATAAVVANAPAKSAPAAKRSVSLDQVRASAPAKKSNEAAGSYLVGGLALLAIIGGIVAATQADSTPTSP